MNLAICTVAYNDAGNGPNCLRLDLSLSNDTFFTANYAVP